MDVLSAKHRTPKNVHVPPPRVAGSWLACGSNVDEQRLLDARGPRSTDLQSVRERLSEAWMSTATGNEVGASPRV